VANKTIQLMLTDVIMELVAKAKLAKKESHTSEYAKGRHFALYEVISLIVEQADAFGVKRAEIGLTNFDPERDLLDL
jgi:hypothetical protein